jgi:hypothetical protein
LSWIVPSIIEENLFGGSAAEAPKQKQLKRTYKNSRVFKAQSPGFFNERTWRIHRNHLHHYAQIRCHNKN